VDGVTPALEATDLYRFYHAGDDETLALRGVSLTVERGDLVAVTGPSGSGKSTLMACLAGLDEPDGGVVRIDGERISRRPEAMRARIRARGIGVLYQSSNLVGHLSVDANVALARRLAGGAADAARRSELLERMGIARRSHARPSELSGGELARAGLAVALANDPAVLLADEPTGELDEVTARDVLALLRERAANGGAVVVATHDAAVAFAAVRELRLRDGSAEA
jgi:putative ABC transport system ATP-binding protein